MMDRGFLAGMAKMLPAAGLAGLLLAPAAVAGAAPAAGAARTAEADLDWPQYPARRCGKTRSAYRRTGPGASPAPSGMGELARSTSAVTRRPSKASATADRSAGSTQ